jgi:hypothetical protein
MAIKRTSGIGGAVWLLVLVAIPTGAFQAANLVPAAWKVWVILAGLAFLLLGLIVNTIIVRHRVIAAAGETTAVEQTLITMKRALAPISGLLAEMPGLTSGRRRTHLDRVSDRAAVSLADYLLRSVPNVRANVYWIDDAATQLFPISHAGAGDLPRTFKKGSPAGETNLAWVRAGGKPRRVGNYVAVDSTDQDQGYRSYLAVVIRAGADAYGMVTVDSPEAEAFTSADEESVSVIAALLAAACAIAYPGNTRPTPRD